MDAEQLKDDLREGRIAADRLVDFLVSALAQLEEGGLAWRPDPPDRRRWNTAVRRSPVGR